MRSNRIVVTALVCCAALTAAARAQEENVRNVEQMLQNAQAELQQSKAEAGRAPTIAADLWEARVRVCANTVECYTRALAAAREQVEATYQKELQAGSRWQSLGVAIQYTIYMEMNSLQVGEIGGEAAAKETLLRQRIRGAVARARGLCMKPLPLNPPDDLELQQTWEVVSTLQSQVSFLTQALTILENKKQTAERQNQEQDPGLRAALEKKLRVQDELVAALERIAAMDPQQDGNAYQQASEKLNDVYRNLQASERACDVAQQKLQDDKRLAEAPPELKPLVQEMMRCRAEGARVRAHLDAQQGGEMMRITLEAKAEAFETRTRALDEIIDQRRQALDRLQEVGKERNDPKVKPFVDMGENILADMEKRVRNRAELEVAGRELQARAGLLGMEVGEISEKLYEVLGKAVEVAAKVREERERLEEMARPEGIQAFADELAAQLQEFGGKMAETRVVAQAIADLTGMAREEALKHAQKAQDLMKAGRYNEARGETTLALEAKLVADELSEFLNARVDLEREVVARGQKARAKAIQDCLADYRKLSDAAAQLIAEAARISRDPKAVEKLPDAVLRRAEVVAKAQEAGARLARLLAGEQAE